MTTTTETKAAKGDTLVKLPANYLTHPAVAPYSQWLSQWRKAYGEPPKPEHFQAAVAMNNRPGSGHAFKVALALRAGGVHENTFKALTGHKNAHNCCRDTAIAGWCLRKQVQNVTTLELTVKGKALVAGKAQAEAAKPATAKPAKPAKPAKAARPAKAGKRPADAAKPVEATTVAPAAENASVTA